MLASNITIRFARDEDANDLLQHVYISENVLQSKIEANEFIVAISKSELSGFVQLEYLWSKVPYIALIRVLSEHRERGIGRALLGFLEDHLRQTNHTVLYSSSQAVSMSRRSGIVT